MLIISRGIAGGLIGLVLTIISEIVPVQERGKYQGMIGGCFGIASVVGPLLGGVLTDKVSWRWAFLINIPLGVITFISVIFLLQLPSPTGSLWSKLLRIDWWGAFTLVVATILLLLSLNWAGTKYAKFAEEPIAPHLKLVACFSVTLFHGMVFFSLVLFIPLYFQVVKSESASTSGLELLPLIMGIVIMAIFSGQVISRTVFFTYGTFCVFGSILMAVGSGLVSTFTEDSSKSEIVIYSLIAGIGIGLIIQITILAGQGIAEPKDIATVTSLVAFFRTMGAVFGIAILDTVFNNVFNSNLPPQYQGSLHGISLAMQGQMPASLTHDFVLALDAAFRIAIIFAGLSLISSLPLITVKPHRDKSIENFSSLE
ncbi:26086_t:CDS:2 [Gigaspora rosea]|nr:26086_t:CDS:2 [Gigaspora rosea]